MARRAPGCLQSKRPRYPRVLQIGIEQLGNAFVSRLSHQSNLSNVSGPRKEKEVENRNPDSHFVRIPLSTVLSPTSVVFSPVSVKENAWNLSLAWFSPTCPAAYPVETALHHVLSSWSPSRHEEYLARLLSYYLLIHHFLPLLPRTVILLCMHCVFS